MCPKDADRMANSVDTDQTALGLHCLPIICPKTYGRCHVYLLHNLLVCKESVL